jgi:hypothetical protein
MNRAQALDQIAKALAKHPKSRIRIDVRVTAKEKADWSKLASELDTNLSSLIRTVMTELANQQRGDRT